MAEVNKTRRSSIVEALASALKQISLVNGYVTDLGGNVYPTMKFWDELNEYPAVCLTAGPESIVHQGGGFKDRYLDIMLRAYVNTEDSVIALEGLLEDIERILDNNGRLAYVDSSGSLGYTRDIILNSIDTDQGALSPLGIGEMSLQVKY